MAGGGQREDQRGKFDNYTVSGSGFAKEEESLERWRRGGLCGESDLSLDETEGGGPTEGPKSKLEEKQGRARHNQQV